MGEGRKKIEGGGGSPYFGRSAEDERWMKKGEKKREGADRFFNLFVLFIYYENIY